MSPIQRGQLKLAEAMLRPINPTAIVLLGVFTIVWGFWVGNPFWSVFDTAKLYSVMSFMPEVAWGAVSFIAGIIITYGAVNKEVKSLLLGALVGGTYWFGVSILFFLGDWMNTGGITTLLLAVYSSFIYLNLKVNSKVTRSKQDLFAG